MSGCGGSGQSYNYYASPFDQSPDGSVLPPTAVGTSQVKVIGLKNPSTTESQFVNGVAIRPGTDGINFSIASVKVGQTAQASFSEIVVPPGEVLYIQVNYNPKSKTGLAERHRAILEVTFGDPEPGTVHIEITGRAEGEMPAPRVSSCEVAACIFEPQVTLNLSSKGIPDPPPPPKTASFSGPILIREVNGEMVVDGLEFPSVILGFTSAEIRENQGVKIVLDGSEGAKGKVTLGEDGSFSMTDFGVRVRLFTDSPGLDLESTLSRNGPPQVVAEGEVGDITFTTDTTSASGNKLTLTVTGQKIGADGAVTIVAAKALPAEVFTKGPLAAPKGNPRLGGAALTAEITGRFERGAGSP